MDILIPSPLPLVEPGDLLERLNGKRASPLVLKFAREYATRGRQAQAWSEAELGQINRELAAYPLFNYLCMALTTRAFNASWDDARGYRQSGAPLRGRISEQDATPYRPALDWLALAGLVQAGIRLGICPGCGKFFVDAKRRGKAACSPTCGNRERARTHYEALKAKPRKYRTYLKKQRELMKTRRAAGLP